MPSPSRPRSRRSLRAHLTSLLRASPGLPPAKQPCAAAAPRGRRGPRRRVLEVIRAHPELGGLRTILRAPSIAPARFSPFLALSHAAAMDAAPLALRDTAAAAAGAAGEERAAAEVETLLFALKGQAEAEVGAVLPPRTPTLVGSGAAGGGGEAAEERVHAAEGDTVSPLGAAGRRESGDSVGGALRCERVPPAEVLSVAIAVPPGAQRARRKRGEVAVASEPVAVRPVRRSGGAEAGRGRATLVALADNVGGARGRDAASADVVTPSAAAAVYELRMTPGARVEIEPDAERVFVYVYAGEAKVGGVGVAEGALVVMEERTGGRGGGRVVVETGENRDGGGASADGEQGGSAEDVAGLLVLCGDRILPVNEAGTGGSEAVAAVASSTTGSCAADIIGRRDVSSTSQLVV